MINGLYRSHWEVRRIIDVKPEDMMKNGAHVLKVKNILEEPLNYDEKEANSLAGMLVVDRRSGISAEAEIYCGASEIYGEGGSEQNEWNGAGIGTGE